MSSEKHILIIEDDEPVARALKLKLSDAGFAVEVALDGKDGLKKLKDATPDLIILDLIMPELDGFDVLEELEEIEGDASVFVFSDLQQKEDKKRAKDLGAEKFFMKSDVQLTEMVKAVEDFFNE